MTSCRRFDEEAVPRLETGGALQDLEDPHYAECDDCRAARESHVRLLGALAATGRLAPGERPRSDWRERVLAEVDKKGGVRPGRRLGWWLPMAGLLAAGLATVFLLTPSRLAPPGLTQRVVAGAIGSRGGGEVARPGDRLELSAETGGAAHAELRLYLNRDRLVLRCTGDAPPCRQSGGRIEADVVLDTRGSYLPLLLLSNEPLPSPGPGFDADTAALVGAGARLEPGREVSVR